MSVATSEVLIMQTTFSNGTKSLLKDLLRKAIDAIDSDDIRGTSDLGILSAHLRAVGEYSQGDGDFDNPTSNMPLCSDLQKCPESWNVPWDEMGLPDAMDPTVYNASWALINSKSAEVAEDQAERALTSSRNAIEKLIASTNTNDQYTLGKLGGILADLKTAQTELESLNVGS